MEMGKSGYPWVDGDNRHYREFLESAVRRTEAIDLKLDLERNEYKDSMPSQI